MSEEEGVSEGVIYREREREREGVSEIIREIQVNECERDSAKLQSKTHGVKVFLRPK